jgi:hypothetical protein
MTGVRREQTSLKKKKQKNLSGKQVFRWALRDERGG